MHSPRRNALAALTILGLLASFLLAAGTPAAASALPGEPPPPHGQDPTTGKLAADRLPLGMEPDRGSALPPPIHVASAGSEQARVPGDEYWVEGFGPPGMDRSVDALVVGPDGTLYAGGFFTTVGSLVAYHIARWDGVSWHPNGAGMNAPVLALAMGPDGSLYAGGAFTTAGGTAANHIARWDAPTSSWHSLGSGIGGDRSYVVALAFGPDGSLYAGGWFTTAGGTPASHITRWDGTTWHPLGSGIEGDFSSVHALVLGPDGSLYAGGEFTTAGGVAANSIARWDAPTSSWYPLGSGMGGVDYPSVSALSFGPDGSLYAGGWFTTAGGVAANHIARWDGAAWHPLGSGVDSWVGTLVVGRGGSLYAGGGFTTAGGVAASRIARWDGAAWRPLGSGMGGEVFALAFGQDNSLYAGGRFTSAGGQAANSIARWDQPSSSWRSVAIGNGMDYSVSALTVGPGGALYAGGDFTTAGATVTNGIARWDGVAWRPLGNGITEDYASVNALAFAPDGSLYAGGWFTTAGGVAANHIARWDGAAWHPLGSGRDFSVYALATGLDGSLYAGGDFVTAGNQALADIARWDGATWHSLGSGMEGDYPRVYALAVGPDGALYAGGTFTTTAGVVVNCIARWDGMAWNPLGSGMGGVDYPSVSALSFGPDGSLYAGGSFTTAGGVEADRVARWDGTTWHPLGSGMDNTVFALAFGPDGSLYAGGDFTTAGGVAANQIARWDGAAWHPLGSGVDSGVGTLVATLVVGRGGSLYAGGGFSTAGGKPSAGIAKWMGQAGHRIMLPLVQRSH